MNHDILTLIDKLPARDQRVVLKILERMVEWHLTFPQALRNASVLWDKNPLVTDAEFEAFERGLDGWIDAGKKYG